MLVYHDTGLLWQVSCWENTNNDFWRWEVHLMPQDAQYVSDFWQKLNTVAIKTCSGTKQDMGWETYKPAPAAVLLRAWNSMMSCDYASLGQGKNWSQPSWSPLQLSFLSWPTCPYSEMIFNVSEAILYQWQGHQIIHLSCLLCLGIGYFCSCQLSVTHDQHFFLKMGLPRSVLAALTAKHPWFQ